MLFAGGMAIPPGTRSLGDYIDANDPCTINPNDPICQLTAQDVANDPCRLNPTGPGCQATVVSQTANSPTPGSNDSQWSQFIDPSYTPKWVTDLLDKVSGANKLNSTPGTVNPLAASVYGGIKTVVVLAVLAGVGIFGYKLYEKRRKASPVAA